MNNPPHPRLKMWKLRLGEWKDVHNNIPKFIAAHSYVPGSVLRTLMCECAFDSYNDPLRQGFLAPFYG